MKIGIIYLTINTLNNKKYVGQTTRLNKKDYLGSGVDLIKDIKKYGKESFVRHTIEVVKGTQETLNNRETYWIQELKPDYNKMTKCTGPGAHSEESKRKISEATIGKPKPKSEETKKKMSESHKGRKPFTDEHKNNIGKSNKGRIPWSKGLTKETDERVKKYSESLKGIKRSEETRRKKSDSLKGKPWTQARRDAQNKKENLGLRQDVMQNKER